MGGRRRHRKDSGHVVIIITLLDDVQDEDGNLPCEELTRSGLVDWDLSARLFTNPVRGKRYKVCLTASPLPDDKVAAVIRHEAFTAPIELADGRWRDRDE
jgi:hypothetical protein